MSIKKYPTTIDQEKPEKKAKKKPRYISKACNKIWRRPTLPLLRSTIGASGLNFSVRYGKRWTPLL